MPRRIRALAAEAGQAGRKADVERPSDGPEVDAALRDSGEHGHEHDPADEQNSRDNVLGGGGCLAGAGGGSGLADVEEGEEDVLDEAGEALGGVALDADGVDEVAGEHGAVVVEVPGLLLEYVP